MAVEVADNDRGFNDGSRIYGCFWGYPRANLDQGGVGRNWFRLCWFDDLHMDSQSAMALAKNPTHHKWSKHIDIKYHWLREHTYESGTVGLAHCRTENMVAGVMTKALDSKLHNKHAVNISGFGDV